MHQATRSYMRRGSHSSGLRGFAWDSTALSSTRRKTPCRKKFAFFLPQHRAGLVERRTGQQVKRLDIHRLQHSLVVVAQDDLGLYLFEPIDTAQRIGTVSYDVPQADNALGPRRWPRRSIQASSASRLAWISASTAIFKRASPQLNSALIEVSSWIARMALAKRGATEHTCTMDVRASADKGIVSVMASACRLD